MVEWKIVRKTWSQYEILIIMKLPKFGPLNWFWVINIESNSRIVPFKTIDAGNRAIHDPMFLDVWKCSNGKTRYSLCFGWTRTRVVNVVKWLFFNAKQVQNIFLEIGWDSNEYHNMTKCERESPKLRKLWGLYARCHLLSLLWTEEGGGVFHDPPVGSMNLFQTVLVWCSFWSEKNRTLKLVHQR